MLDPSSASVDELVQIPADGVALAGELRLPAGARSLVVFAHGSGSSRHSPRNQLVAERLRRAGIGTLLIDLLSEREGSDRRLVFDIELLARRLAAIANWVAADPATRRLAIGLFGASTGAAAALQASVDGGARIGAVVSRGGRPDLAASHLPTVTAPTLLIVGGEDRAVIGLNRQAAALLRCEHELAIVPGATHLFQEAGALEQVSDLARDWFLHHLADHGGEPPSMNGDTPQ